MPVRTTVSRFDRPRLCVRVRRSARLRGRGPVHATAGRIAAALVLGLAAATAARAQCPDPADFAADAPTLLGTYSPFDIRSNAPDSSTVCLGTGPQTPCAVHHVYVPGGTAPQPPTVLFLPGSGMEPDKHDLVLQMAAYAGYRTIGLAYDNAGSVSSLCGTPPCSDDCAELVHRERVTGEDVSPVTATAVGDAILSRLYALLVELHSEDVADGSNDLHWDALYEPAAPGATSLDMSAIHWERLYVMGFSQGGSHAAYIAKTWRVGAAMVLDAGGELCNDGVGGTRPEDWVLDPVDASVGRPRFGVAHARGATPPLGVQETWDDLGFGPVPGEDLDLGGFAVPPPTAAYSDQTKVAGPDCTEHSSMAKDGCMPTAPDSQIAAASPDAAHLFEPYLLRLCQACIAPGCNVQSMPVPLLAPAGLAALCVLCLGFAALRSRRPLG